MASSSSYSHSYSTLLWSRIRRCKYQGDSVRRSVARWFMQWNSRSRKLMVLFALHCWFSSVYPLDPCFVPSVLSIGLVDECAFMDAHTKQPQLSVRFSQFSEQKTTSAKNYFPFWSMLLDMQEDFFSVLNGSNRCTANYLLFFSRYSFSFFVVHQQKPRFHFAKWDEEKRTMFFPCVFCFYSVVEYHCQLTKEKLFRPLLFKPSLSAWNNHRLLCMEWFGQRYISSHFHSLPNRSKTSKIYHRRISSWIDWMLCFSQGRNE